MSASAGAAKSVSTQTFVTALVTSGAVALIEIAVFMIIRNRYRRVYSPRSYLVPPRKRIDALPTGLFAWIPAILRADAKQIIEKNGLDAYVFVRFLYLMIEIFLPFFIVTWAIILPVVLANSTGVNEGINRWTFGNVGLDQTNRYAAFIIVVWLLTFYVFYLIRREMDVYVTLRHNFLLSRSHTNLPQSKTVMVTGVTKELLTVEALTKFSSVLPGGVKRVWLARDLGDLPDLYERRLKASDKLESAETALLKAAAKAIRKKKVADAPTPEELEADPSLISRYVSAKDRPHHKLGFFGLWGKKVDSIDWAREEIVTTTQGLDEGKVTLAGPDVDDKYPAHSAAFIQFNSQIAAHMFAQCLAHGAPLKMSSRYLEVSQEDVIWANVAIDPLQARLRYAIGWCLTAALIIFWAIPVAFVALISNVNELCTTVAFLSWLCKLPTPINGILQGVLPPLALSILLSLLPAILRLILKHGGVPLHSQIELTLMTRYFVFLAIHGFLIVTLASGLVSAIPQITQNPGSAATLLATQLPSASTFFLTFILMQTLAGAAGGLLQIGTLVVYYVKLVLLGSTPRGVYAIRGNLSGVEWGALFPSITLLTIIGIVYSVIAPIVSLFAALGFVLLWMTYKYLFIWVLETPPHTETGGLFYPKALSHVFVGLYIEEICLAGLFFLQQNSEGKQACIAEGILMVVLIVITILFQITLNSGYSPLIDYLPLSAADRMEDSPQSETPPMLGAGDSRLDNRNNPEKQDSPLMLHASNGREAEGLMKGKSNESVNRGDEHLDVHAFDHPSSYVEQRTIWLPVDEAGLYKGEVDSTRAAGIDVSTEGATLSSAGKVNVVRAPPGYDWDESQSL